MSYGVKVVGHVTPKKEKVYVLEDGEAITFHTARMEGGELVVFHTPLNVWPSITAGRLGLEYKFLRNSTPDEIALAVEGQALAIKNEVVMK